MLKIYLIMVFFIMGIFQNTYAWPDGNKKGFILGISVGESFMNLAQDNSVSGTSFLADLRVGGGFNEESALCFKYRYGLSSTGNDMLHHAWIWTGEYSHFLKNNNLFFLNCGAGFMLMLNHMTGETNSGPVVYIGCVRELIRYLPMNFDLSVGFLSDNTTYLTVGFTVGFLGY